MKGLLLWALLLLPAVWAAGNVIVVDDDTFDDVVLNSDKTSFVKFYADWCGHCKKMLPEWEKLADSYADVDDVQIVKINSDISRSIGKRYNVDAYPSLKLFRADALSDPIDYTGQRDFDYLANFLSNSVGIKGKNIGKASKIVQVHDGNIEKFIENKGKSAILLFTTEKDCDDCIAKKKVFDELSQAFHKELDKIIIGEVQKNGDEPTDWIRELYGITEFPSIVFVDKDDVNNFEKYNGEQSSPELISFVNNKIGTRRAANGLLDTQAGLIPDMEEALAKFIGINIVDRRAYVPEFIDLLKKVDDEFFKNEVKYYALIVNQFIAGNKEYVNTELAKFEKKLADKAVAPEEKDLVNMKVNLLKHINTLVTGETYKDAEDVMKEREESTKLEKDEL